MGPIFKFALVIVGSFSSVAFASFNGGAPEVGSKEAVQNYECILSDGSLSQRPAQLSVRLSAGEILEAQLRIQYIELEPKFNETMSVVIQGPLVKTTSGEIGVRKGRVPILSRADLQEFSFPELRGHDFKTLPNQIQFRYSSVSGPVGQTGGNLMTGVCSLANGN